MIRPFSPAEDELLRNVEYGGFSRLACELGRSLKALRARRDYLNNGPKTQAMHYLAPPPKPSRPRPVVFARPVWFDEDLGRMARSKR